MKTQKTMYFENSYETARFHAEADILKQNLQHVVTAWNKITAEYFGASKPLTMQIFTTYLQRGKLQPASVESYLRETLARERQSTYPDFDFQDLKQRLKKPDISELETAVSEIDTYLLKNLHCFEFSADSVSMVPEEVEKALNVFREYAEGEAEHLRLKQAERIRDVMNEILSGNPHISATDCTIPRLLFVNDGKLQISFQFVKLARLGDAHTAGDLLFSPSWKADTEQFKSHPDGGLNLNRPQAEIVKDIIKRRNAQNRKPEPMQSDV